MTRLYLLGIACVALLLGACAKPQTIFIETAPPGAAISIDSEFVGRSPAQIDIDNVKKHKTLRIVAEKSAYQTSTKTLKKKKTGLFPKAVFLKLDETPTRNTAGASGSGSQQGGQQTTIQGPTIQGPTIVFPGMSPTPQVSAPPAPKQ